MLLEYYPSLSTLITLYWIQLLKSNKKQNKIQLIINQFQFIHWWYSDCSDLQSNSKKICQKCSIWDSKKNPVHIAHYIPTQRGRTPQRNGVEIEKIWEKWQISHYTVSPVCLYTYILFLSLLNITETHFGSFWRYAKKWAIFSSHISTLFGLFFIENLLMSYFRSQLFYR